MNEINNNKTDINKLNTTKRTVALTSTVTLTINS